MVRKLNKVKKKKCKIKIRSTEEIDFKINEFMKIMKPILGEENIFKLNKLTKDTSSISFMSMIFAVITRTMSNVNEHSKEAAKKDCLEILDKYNKEYIPRIPTLYFCNFFAINKIIHRYFKVNYFKNNFKKNNEDTLYDIEEYKRMNDMIKIKPIKQSKDRIFEGIWNDKINNLSKQLNDILKLLNQMRETYIIKENLIEEYDRVKKSLVLSYEGEEKLTKKDFNYLKKVFGNSEKGIEIIESYKKSIQERYVPETNIIQDIIFYVMTIQLEQNLESFRKNIILITNNGLFANNVIIKIKQITTEILKFLTNFENLVNDGKDEYDDNIRIPYGKKVGEYIELNSK